LPHTAAGLPAYYLLTLAEASSNLARYDGVEYGQRPQLAADCNTVEEMITATRGSSFGSEVKRRILTGAFTLSRTLYDSHYVQAQRVRRRVCDDFATVFSGTGIPVAVDVLLTPTACGPAPTLEAARQMSHLEVLSNDVFTVPSSLAGLPAISIPAGHDDETGLPLGLQLIGARECEATVLRVAQALEEEYAQ
jgi:aspartyl-tRNA(Asn)/glutamyl-tRNA(Gln) amidotransferase subunit A